MLSPLGAHREPPREGRAGPNSLRRLRERGPDPSDSRTGTWPGAIQQVWVAAAQQVESGHAPTGSGKTWGRYNRCVRNVGHRKTSCRPGAELNRIQEYVERSNDVCRMATEFDASPAGRGPLTPSPSPAACAGKSGSGGGEGRKKGLRSATRFRRPLRLSGRNWACERRTVHVGRSSPGDHDSGGNSGRFGCMRAGLSLWAGGEERSADATDSAGVQGR